MAEYNSLMEVMQYFSNEETCKQHLEKLRWNGKPVCPFCKSEKVYRTNRGFKCGNKECYKKFSVTVGTFFENTKISLQKWFVAMYLCTSHKKGISSLQLAKDIKVAQKTAWFMLHRIREMMKDKAPQMLDSTVECDETYIGGKNKNRHYSKKLEGKGTANKQPVFGLIERNGNVVAMPVQKADGDTLLPIIKKHVIEGSTLMTDEHGAYFYMDAVYNHCVIRHSSKIYVNGDIHTNSIENFWSMLKRGIIGVYHQVSVKHLAKYCNEFAFRYNTRKLDEQTRLDVAGMQCQGRLKYNDLIA